ncbi:MAG: TatD family deoxyribonuclease [Methanobacteriota archaeon]|nr:MAG: TatD family deoxyribonuclease [Euryarchaeota archaeon]
MFIDSHCHLHEPWFPDDSMPKVIQRAKAKGVDLIVNCSSDPTTFEQVRKSGMFPEIFTTLGLQPTIAPNFLQKDLFGMFSEQLDSSFGDRIVGIGEVGLDYYWVKDEKQRKNQEAVFIEIIKVANQLDKPLVIHCRKAEGPTLSILEKYAEVPVLLHSFDGTAEEAKKAVDLGYPATIPTNLTRRKKRRKTAKRFGLENIMIETDSPFCAPLEDIERNEPGNIPIAARKLAEDFEIEIKELAKITSSNAKRFYKIP